MTIYELAEMTQETLRIARYGSHFSARLSNAEIRNGEFLVTVFGEGKSPNGAIRDYVWKIRGQVLIFNATRGILRKSVVVPKSLVHTAKRQKQFEDLRD